MRIKPRHLRMNIQGLALLSVLFLLPLSGTLQQAQAQQKFDFTYIAPTNLGGGPFNSVSDIQVAIVDKWATGAQKSWSKSDKEKIVGKAGLDLIRLYHEFKTHEAEKSNVEFKSSNKDMPLVGTSVSVDFGAADDMDQVVADLTNLGITIVASAQRIISARLPISSIPDAAAIQGLRFIRPAYYTVHVGAVTSQGDTAQKSDDARTSFGFDGTGITVGTLSDSFDTATAPLTTYITDTITLDLPAGPRPNC